MISLLLFCAIFSLGMLALAYVTSEAILDYFDTFDDNLTVLTWVTLFYVVVLCLIFHFGV